jgi:hypothetical protein
MIAPGNSEPNTSPASDTSTQETNHATPYNGQPDELHDLFAVQSAPGSDDDDPLAALRNDPNYSALIRDLEYIAKQARLLFEPAQEAPSDEVWNKIASQLGNKPPDA